MHGWFVFLSVEIMKTLKDFLWKVLKCSQHIISTELILAWEDFWKAELPENTAFYSFSNQSQKKNKIFPKKKCSKLLLNQHLVISQNIDYFLEKAIAKYSGAKNLFSYELECTFKRLNFIKQYPMKRLRFIKQYSNIYYRFSI